jgi:hypothetical protein
MTRIGHRCLRGGLAALALLAVTAPALASTITIVNVDGAGEGFNDPTPVAPVGGNTGTTRGQQRLIAFQFAADVWGALLPSAVEIRVTASFDPLNCSATTAVLGSAGARGATTDFPGAPIPNTYYHVALANKLAGYDLSPGDPGTSADEIQARFNVSVDEATCLTASNWYYGLDGNNGNDIDLVVVLLHEFGHGLGFASLVNNSTGALAGGLPDIYSRFLYDNTVGLHWPAMSNSQRVASAVNQQNVVFDGDLTTATADDWLDPASEVVVSEPAAVAGAYAVADAAWGPTVASQPVSGEVVLVEDGTSPVNDGCEVLLNSAQLPGRIALVDRGLCTFAAKVQAAQDAGAIGVIVVNNVAGAMNTMGGSGPGITIPAVMISQTDGNLLKMALPDGVFATIRSSTERLAGADAQGRVLVFTPNPLQTGSSVSHFDANARPNLLMEPAFQSDVGPRQVDLALSLFHDEGWFHDALAPATHGGVRALLRQNTPNPFNPSTTIAFSLAEGGDTELRVFDVRGRNLRVLAAGDLPAGEHSVSWDGHDEEGRPMPSGIYFYKLKCGDFEGLQRMVLLR